MIEKPIAVLGGGHGGHTMAADLSLAGYKINLCEHPLFVKDFEHVLEHQAIKLTGIGRTGEARLNMATTDMGKALSEVTLINIVLPAFGHDLFFEEMIPHIRPGQIVIIWAGNYGSLRLAHLLRESCTSTDIVIGETNTLPYGTRLTAPGEVNCALKSPKVAFSALPASRTCEVLPCIQELWPGLVVFIDNVLITALSNPNPICHPPGSLLNIGRIQWSGGNFYMYKEGITEAVARVIRGVYEEAAALGRALGGQVLEYEERDFRTPGSIMARAFEGPFDTLSIIGGIQGPKSIYDRYITEDLPYGLVPMAELGEKLEVETPLINGLITIGNFVCNTDFRRESRVLGIEHMNKADLLDYVNG